LKKTILSSLATAAKIKISTLGAKQPEVGMPSPLFEAQSTDGLIRLTDYLGKRHIILAFYYADFTPG